MTIIRSVTGFDESGSDGEAVWRKPLTAEEARALRESDPSVSAGQVLRWQLLLGSVLTVLAFLLTQRSAVGWSVGYGVLAVLVPAALFARGLFSRVTLSSPGAAVAGFFVWELVKIGATLGMLFAAPRLVPELVWPALLVGLIVTMKVYWVALLVRPKKLKPAP